MPTVRTSSDIGVWYEAKHEDSAGRLIYAAHTRKYPWERYEHWRARYCQQHRRDALWLSFREGRRDPLTLAYAGWLYMKEEKAHGTNTERNS